MSSNRPLPIRPGYAVEGKVVKQAGRTSDTDAIVVLEDGTIIEFHAKYVYDQMDGGEAVLVVKVNGQ